VAVVDTTYQFIEPVGAAYEIRLTVVPVGHPHKGAIWTLKRTPSDAAEFRAILADFLAQLNTLPETSNAPE
jgi:hypothetical protein